MTSVDELQDYEDELQKIFTYVRKEIEVLKKLKTENERNQKEALLDKRLQRAKEVLRSYKVDIRELPKAEQHAHQQKTKEHTETINSLIQDLKWAAEGASLKGGVTPKKKDVDSMTADEILETAKKTQESSIGVLDNIDAIIETSKGVAAETNVKLKAQSEQLGKVSEGLDEVQTNLKMAAKQLRAFARRIATDKLILVFIVLIVAGLIFVIVWSIIHPKAKTNVNEYLFPNGIGNFTNPLS